MTYSLSAQHTDTDPINTDDYRDFGRIRFYYILFYETKLQHKTNTLTVMMMIGLGFRVRLD
jgi:hypothetical protein